ncbi:MAG: Rpn family recombination-promoting nuclease/putative transposase [Cyanobacteria bacterium P01_G01_bin.54]
MDCSRTWWSVSKLRARALGKAIAKVKRDDAIPYSTWSGDTGRERSLNSELGIRNSEGKYKHQGVSGGDWVSLPNPSWNKSNLGQWAARCIGLTQVRETHRHTLNVEFQTRTDKTMSFRMLDYFTRLYRKFPERRIHQVVVYLLETDSPLVSENQFTASKTEHRYEVIRLWEQPKNLFIHSLGLLPLAVIANAQPDEPEQVLRDVAQRIEAVPDAQTKSNLTASAALLAGLKLDKDIIRQIFRSDVMRESVIYQDILQEGRQEGRQLERRYILRTLIPLLKRFKFPVEVVLNALGVTMAEIEGEEQTQENDMG